MKHLGIKNCFSAFLAIGCLFTIAIIIVVLIFIRNLKEDKPLFYFNNDISIQDLEEKDNDITRNSHLYPKNKTKLMEILLISDTEDFWENTKRALEAGKNGNVDFGIHLGDVTHLGVPSKLSEAKELFDNSGVTLYPIPGDRDLWKSRQTTDGLAAFKDVFGEDYRVVDYRGIKFLLIDNSNIYEGIDDKQWSFIDENISDTDFVFFHNPIYFNESYLFGDKGMGQYSQDVEQQRIRLLETIRKSNVKAVFAGNQHMFSETVDKEKQGLNHYVIGSLNPDRNLQMPNFSTLTIYEDGDYYVKKIDLK